MIRENQRFLNRLNMTLDGFLVYVSLLLAFGLRFFVLHGIPTVPFVRYLESGLFLAPFHVLLYAFFGLYESARKMRLYRDLGRLLGANALAFALWQMALFLLRSVHFSRGALFFYFLLVNLLTGSKRVFVRKLLHRLREEGYNQKYVVVIGGGNVAHQYMSEVTASPELGLTITGYVADQIDWQGLRRLGGYGELETVLDRCRPDEVVCALEVQEYQRMPEVIRACEKTGVKLSLIPFYADYMPSHPQIDSINNLPLINLRRIPLDNLGNAFLKRTVDIVGALFLIILFSPVMMTAAIGVKCSSPGPIIFKQKRVGLNKREFYMYKFRSMRVNDSSDTAWSTNDDDRKTKFGSFIRKFSIDELPQFFNVLKGDMSLVGPRPEIPHFVEQFKEEIPLYMVKHQVRPGITGWAQVNGLRGDTSITERIRCDIYYIENWTLLFDIKILLMTMFKGIANQEKLN